MTANGCSVSLGDGNNLHLDAVMIVQLCQRTEGH